MVMDKATQKECFGIISESLYSHQWRRLGLNLNLTDAKLNQIETDTRRNGEGAQDVYRKMLIEWSQMYPMNVTVEFLNTALKRSGRTDLAEQIYEVSNACKHPTSASSIQNVSPYVSASSGDSTLTFRQPSQSSNVSQNVSEPDSPADSQTWIMQKKNIICGFLFFAILVFICLGKSSLFELLQGFVEALMVYVSLHATGYLFGRLITNW